MSQICPSCFHDNPDGAHQCVVCGTLLTPIGPHLPPKTQLQQGDYQIQTLLGQGAFGITYKAIYRPKNIPVAIKELWAENGYRHGTTLIWPPSLSPKLQQEQIEKFKFEVACLQQCNSPHIAKVYQFFQENSTIYMSMELIEGLPLSARLKQQAPLPETEVIQYAYQLSQALTRVHQNNLLHRDIKPENIILTPQGRVVLIDFGSAREFIAGKTGDMTRILTPEYAPIEQYLSRTKRLPATDIYALCASLYELLTGQVATPSLDRANALSQSLSDPLIPPRQLNPNLNPSLEDILLKGLNFKIEDRIQSAQELQHQLQPLLPPPPSPSVPKSAYLICKNTRSKKRIPLKKYLKIGIKDPKNSDSIDLDLSKFIGSETVSSQHAVIYINSGQWMIKDMGSTNGTFIKPQGQSRFGARITQPNNLQFGDEIALGKVQFILTSS